MMVNHHKNNANTSNRPHQRLLNADGGSTVCSDDKDGYDDITTTKVNLPISYHQSTRATIGMRVIEPTQPRRNNDQRYNLRLDSRNPLKPK
jgi:hypothetical protein